MTSRPRPGVDPRPDPLPSRASKPIEPRVVRVAEAALVDRGYVSAIDILVGLGWLAPSHVDAWRQGRAPDLESAVSAGPGKISTAINAFERWARQRGLLPSETAYVARTRDRRSLRFSLNGSPPIERAYRTHWVSPDLSERRRQSLAERATRPPDLVVIWARHDWTCTRCSTTSGGLLIMEDGGPVCLACAGMDHLVYLPRGDAGLSRRAKLASGVSAVVVRWSGSRRRYERGRGSSSNGSRWSRPSGPAADRRPWGTDPRPWGTARPTQHNLCPCQPIGRGAPSAARAIALTPASATMELDRAGVAQLAERQPSKLNVAGSNPVSRSRSLL